MARPSLVGVAVLLVFVSLATAQSQPQQLTGEGAIVAFHRHWRHPVWNPEGREMSEFATRADLWIVRMDRWIDGSARGRYFLVQYMLYQRAVTDEETNQPRLRFQLRKPQEGDGSKPCEGLTSTGREQSTLRPKRITDFQRTRVGLADSVPPLKDLPCLIAEKPPIVVEAKRQEHGRR